MLVKTVGRDGRVKYVTRRKPRRHFKKRRETAFDAMQPKNPKTMGSIKGYDALGIYKGARIMKAGAKKHPQYTREIEIIYERPVNRKANPQLIHLK